jgi:LmbE family N-acetylglucosaminyl deacetylase
MKLDILVFGPHPDDAEIGAGGVLIKMKALGHTNGICDLTTGDMGWGAPEDLLAE